MIYLVISLIVLLVIAATLGLISEHFHGETPIIEAKGDCNTCSGEDDSCEQDCMLEAATKPVEYFDDEELDAYAGRLSDQYSSEEVDQFYEILTTLRPEEVKPWGRSLILRGINMPDGIKDEFILLSEDLH